MEFTGQQLKEWSNGRWTSEPTGPICGFNFDSRRIERGELFICLKTDQRDGHDFIADAAAAGAVAALVREPRAEIDLPQLVVEDPLKALGEFASAHRRRFEGPVVGITGSCGKTSTKDLLTLLLGGASSVHSTRGNYNNEIGVPLTLLGLNPARHRFAVVEAGINRPGEMEKLAAMIQPTHALITIIAPAHLEELKDLNGVAREKAHLARILPHTGAVVVPSSCLLYEDFYDLPAPVFHAVEDGDAGVEEADVRYRVEQLPSRTVLHIRREDGWQVFTARQISSGMAANAVLAIQMANLLGISDHEIQQRLLLWSPSSFRGEVIDYGSSRFYVDCYNANPAAMEDSLDFFRQLSDGAKRRLYVLGCMGELGSESENYHRDLGRRIRLKVNDRMLITGNEEVGALREGLLLAGNDPDQITVFSRIEEIEHEVVSHDGFVFIKGSRAYGLEALVKKAAERAGREGRC